MSNRKDLPPPSAPNFQQRLRETVMTYLGKQGDPLDRGLTLRDLIESGIIKLKNGFGPGGSGGGALPLDPGSAVYVQDLTPPPAPTGFSASASIVNVLFETDAPKFRVGNGHLKTVIYGISYAMGDPLPTFADAVKVTEFPGNVSGHPLDPGSKWRYWATWVTRDGVEGQPAGGTNGIEATTDLIDSAKIISLSASQITAGTISVGDYIESSSYVPNTSGWRINGDGTAFLENAVVRGTVYATNGTFAGALIGATGTFTGSVSGGKFTTGNFVGYEWPSTGDSGTYLGPGGLLMGNYNTGKYLQVTSTGDIYAPSFNIVNGNATFAGALSAASGTFSGSLTANAVNAVNTINIAGQAVTTTEMRDFDIYSGLPHLQTTSGSSQKDALFYMSSTGDVFTVTTSNYYSSSIPWDRTTTVLYINGVPQQSFYGEDDRATGSITLMGKATLAAGWHTISVTHAWSDIEPPNGLVCTTKVLIFKGYR